MLGYNPHITLPSIAFTKPAIAILLPVVGGNLIGFATSKNAQAPWFTSLKKPPLYPPGKIFGPVWLALYTTMGYAAYRSWTVGMASLDPRVVGFAKQGATLYTIQLGLNFLWSPLFFGFRRPIASLVDIVALTGITGYMTYVWNQVDDVSALLMVPYLAWLSFATYLNSGVGYLNGWDFTYRPDRK